MKLSKTDLLFYDVNNVHLFLDGAKRSEIEPRGRERAGVQRVDGTVTDT